MTVEDSDALDELGSDERGPKEAPIAERTFAALPPAQGRGFARTWWGQRWLKALEESALDAGQLRQGRAYARKGAVGAVTIRPGRITALVLGQDQTRYRADVLLQELSSTEWDRLLEIVAGQAGHIAALLDGEMPSHLVEDATTAGVELLPGIGDLEPECACGTWDHCPHTAALSYQLARLLDEDPFVLLLMRGRGQREVMNDLQARSMAHAARAVDVSPDGGTKEPEQAGVSAAEVYAFSTIRPPLPELPEPVEEPGVPPTLDGLTPPAPGVEEPAIELLAADSAARAQRMLAEALTPGHQETAPAEPLTVWEDAVRLATAHPGRALSARIAACCGRSPREVELAVCAWSFGGAAGLSALEESWTPYEEVLARARAQITAAWTNDGRPPQLRATRNRWTAVGTDAQVRYGRDGRWWPFRKVRNTWWPAGGAEANPAAALAVALRRGEAE